MRKGWRKHVWLTQVVVAVGYALAYLAVRPISDAQWTLTSGLRIACLLLTPYRLWPALVAGEAIPLTFWNYKIGLDYGLAWVMLASVPPVAIGMPIVWWCRKRLALFSSRRLINMGALLQCLLWLSMGWAVSSYLLYLMARPSHPEEALDPALGMVMYFLGSYLGMVSILPWALVARLEHGQGEWRLKLRKLLASEMTRDILFVVLPLMMALSSVSFAYQDGIGKVARAALFLPVVWLTLKYGWRAAVLGGTFVVICVCVLFECRPDAEMLQIQTYVVIAVSCLYALGAHISAHRKQADQARVRVQEAKRLARSGLNFGEQRLEQASKALECVLDVLGIEQLRVSDRLRSVVTDEERRVYDKQASLLQQRIYLLAESMHPSAWRQGGLQAALCHSVGRVMREAGVSYRFNISGRQSNALSPSMQSVVYRSVCTAVSTLSSDLMCATISAVMREGVTHGHRWIMLRIDGELTELAVARNIFRVEERERVAPKLGAHTVDFRDLRNLIQLFDGDLRISESKDRVRVSALLFDEVNKAKEGAMSVAPSRLWVG